MMDNDQEHIGILVSTLYADPEHAQAALQELIELGAPALPAIFDMLDSEYQPIRKSVRDALIARGYHDKSALLSRLANGEDESLREEAISILLGLLGLEDAHAVPAILELLALERARSRANYADVGNMYWSLEKTIDRLGTYAAAELIKAIGNERAEIRSEAARMMASAFKSTAPLELVNLLADADRDVRISAVWALGTINDIGAAPAIMESLSDSDPEVQAMAATALGWLHYDDAKPLVRKLLKHSSSDVRIAALAALSELHDSSILPDIMNGLKDNDRDIRWAAGLALQKVPSASLTSETVTELLQALNSTNDDIKGHIIRTFGNLHEARVVNALIKALEKETGVKRKMIVESLSNSKDPRALPVFVNLLSDPDPQMRITAVHAIGENNPRSKLSELYEVLRYDDDSLVRSSVVQIIVSEGFRESIPVLLEVLNDLDPFIRYDCAKALGKIGAPTAIEGLGQHLTDIVVPTKQNESGFATWTMPYRICDVAAWSLRRIGTPEALSAISGAETKVGGFREITHLL